MFALTVFVINYFTANALVSLIQGGNHLDDLVTACDQISVKDIWTKTLPKFYSESNFMLNDVNKDGVLDVIIGYGTG